MCECDFVTFYHYVVCVLQANNLAGIIFDNTYLHIYRQVEDQNTFEKKIFLCTCMDVRVFWVNTITIILRLFKHASQVKFKLSCNFPPIFIKYWIFHRAIIEIKGETG